MLVIEAEVGTALAEVDAEFGHLRYVTSFASSPVVVEGELATGVDNIFTAVKAPSNTIRAAPTAGNHAVGGAYGSQGGGDDRDAEAHIDWR